VFGKTKDWTKVRLDLYQSSKVILNPLFNFIKIPF
jgi:hypothetical protein